MITFEKAKALLENVKSQRKGKELTDNVFLVKFKGSFLILKDRVPLVTINKDNEYILGPIKASKVYAMLLNKFTPASVKLIGKTLFFDNMPFYEGMKLNAEGEVIIPEAWSDKCEEHFTCKDCQEVYSNSRCPTCNIQYVEDLEYNADEVELDNEFDSDDDDF